MENKVTLEELITKVKSFCEEREWDQFHNPKDLAIGISTEANELLDIFRFKSIEQMQAMLGNTETKRHIEEELADVFFFVLRFAQMNNLDLVQCLDNKLVKNAIKYPVDKAKGSNLKYTEM